MRSSYDDEGKSAAGIAAGNLPVAFDDEQGECGRTGFESPLTMVVVVG